MSSPAKLSTASGPAIPSEISPAFRRRGNFAAMGVIMRGFIASGRSRIAKQLFAAMEIERENKAKRHDWVLRGFRQFDAPVSVVVTYDRAIHGGDIAHRSIAGRSPTPWSTRPGRGAWGA